MVLERRTQPVEAFVIRNRPEQQALRIADVQHNAVHGLAARLERRPVHAGRQPHRRAKQLRVAMPLEPRQLLDATLGLDGELQRTVGRLQPEQRAQRTHTVPRHFSAAAVRVHQRHRRTSRCRHVDDEAVGTDARGTVAHLAREFREVHAFHLRSEDVEKVVPVGVRFGETDHLRQNASRCQPKRSTTARGSKLKVPTKRPL